MVFDKRLAKTFIGGLAALGLTVSIAQADAVTDRQATMKQVGDSMKALAAIAKGEAAFDAAVVKSNGEKLAKLFETAKGLFPPGSETGEKETWAKPEIWQDKDTFLKIMDDGIAASTTLAAVAAEDGLRPALGNLGNNGCKACHEKFRRPKE
ncbi:MAG: c-type cytochrome [Aestuariivirgaceae bacterium]